MEIRKKNRLSYATFVIQSLLQYYTKAEIRERNTSHHTTIRVYTVEVYQELVEAEWNSSLRQGGKFP